MKAFHDYHDDRKKSGHHSGPAELASELDIKAGTRLEWSKGRHGELGVRPLPGRGDLARRLTGIGRGWPRCCWARYLLRPLFDRLISVDEALVAHAIALKRATTSRLPSIDALIAAAASPHEATLVHRDAHFQAIPVDWLQQEVLGSD